MIYKRWLAYTSAISNFYCANVYLFQKKFGNNKKRLYICIIKRIAYGKIITKNIKSPSIDSVLVVSTSHDDGRN